MSHIVDQEKLADLRSGKISIHMVEDLLEKEAYCKEIAKLAPGADIQKGVDFSAFEFEEIPNAHKTPVIGIVVESGEEEYVIHNPFQSFCNSFAVDPEQEYQIPGNIAKELHRINVRLENHGAAFRSCYPAEVAEELSRDAVSEYLRAIEMGNNAYAEAREHADCDGPSL